MIRMNRVWSYCWRPHISISSFQARVVNQTDLRAASIPELEDLQITQHVVDERKKSMIAQVAVLVGITEESHVYTLHSTLDLSRLCVDDNAIWDGLASVSLVLCTTKYKDRRVTEGSHQGFTSRASWQFRYLPNLTNSGTLGVFLVLQL